MTSRSTAPWFLLISAPLVLVVLFAGCGKRDVRQAPPPPPVVVGKVERRPIYRVGEWIGRLDGSANVDIRARVSGFIQEIAFNEGASVKKGDLLLKIDPRPFEAAFAQAEAGLAKAVATQGKTAADEKRQTQLFQSKAASQQDYDNAVQANLAAKASVAAAEAQLLQAKIDLDFATITSPIDGIAGAHKLNVGDFLSAGSSGTPVTTISTVDPIKLVFGIMEKDYLAHARDISTHLQTPIGERARVAELIRADGGIHHEKGVLASVDRAVSAETGTILVTALFPNPGNILRPGQFARIRLKSPMPEPLLAVPQKALVELQGRSFLWVVADNNVARMRPVMPGRADGEFRIISEGVAEGERIIIEGVHRAVEGRPVTPLPASPPGSPRVEGEAKPEAEAKSSGN